MEGSGIEALGLHSYYMVVEGMGRFHSSFH
jgi:hypothetical protein